MAGEADFEVAEDFERTDLSRNGAGMTNGERRALITETKKELAGLNPNNALGLVKGEDDYPLTPEARVQAIERPNSLPNDHPARKWFEGLQEKNNTNPNFDTNQLLKIAKEAAAERVGVRSKTTKTPDDLLRVSVWNKEEDLAGLMDRIRT